MGIKSFAQTRWLVEPQSVTIYPYRIFNVFSIVFAVIFGGMIIWMGQMLYPNLSSAVSGMAAMFIGLALIILLLAGIARTFVIFDNRTKLMQKKLFGIFPIRSEAFDQVEGINIVRSTMGGYNYRAYPKKNKYGKGIVVSASYGRDDDANAIALNQEAFTVIRQFLAQANPAFQQEKVYITDYNFYDANPPYYTVKKNKILSVIIGLALIAFSINELINKTTTYDASLFNKVLVIGGTLLGGAVFTVLAFSKIVFDTTNHTVTQLMPFGINNRTYYFNDFVTFQITRRTTNLIYSGTDVNMYFQIPGTNKQKALVLKTFRSTKKIDDFLKETRHIMGL